MHSVFTPSGVRLPSSPERSADELHCSIFYFILFNQHTLYILNYFVGVILDSYNVSC